MCARFQSSQKVKPRIDAKDAITGNGTQGDTNGGRKIAFQRDRRRQGA